MGRKRFVRKFIDAQYSGGYAKNNTAIQVIYFNIGHSIEFVTAGVFCIEKTNLKYSDWFMLSENEKGELISSSSTIKSKEY